MKKTTLVLDAKDLELANSQDIDTKIQDKYMKEMKEFVRFIAFKNRKERKKFIDNFKKALKEDIKDKRGYH